MTQHRHMIEACMQHMCSVSNKRFRDIFATHSGSFSVLVLRSEFTTKLLPTLLAWLQQNKSSVQIFQSVGEKPVDKRSVGSLVSSEQCIRLTDLCRVSTRSSLVSAFKGLGRCILSSDADDSLDLAPPGALPRLKHLLLLVLHQTFVTWQT